MEQIKAHIAVSLDGHTATPDYELDWMPREVKELVGQGTGGKGVRRRKLPAYGGEHLQLHL